MKRIEFLFFQSAVESRAANYLGIPGVDFPVLDAVPVTAFKCDLPGYYGDVYARCQVFHICQADGRHDSFLCPNGTLFNQKFLGKCLNSLIQSRLITFDYATVSMRLVVQRRLQRRTVALLAQRRHLPERGVERGCRDDRQMAGRTGAEAEAGRRGEGSLRRQEGQREPDGRGGGIDSGRGTRRVQLGRVDHDPSGGRGARRAAAARPGRRPRRDGGRGDAARRREHRRGRHCRGGDRCAATPGPPVHVWPQGAIFDRTQSIGPSWRAGRALRHEHPSFANRFTGHSFISNYRTVPLRAASKRRRGAEQDARAAGRRLLRVP